MNKNQYRLIFNAARGQVMAVAEVAASSGKSASPAIGTWTAKMKPMALRRLS